LTATTERRSASSIAAFGESALYWVWKARQRPFSGPLTACSAKPISLNTPLFCATLILKPLSNGSRNICLNVAR
jgi:hypothetical protein